MGSRDGREDTKRIIKRGAEMEKKRQREWLR